MGPRVGGSFSLPGPFGFSTGVGLKDYELGLSTDNIQWYNVDAGLSIGLPIITAAGRVEAGVTLPVN